MVQNQSHWFDPIHSLSSLKPQFLKISYTSVLSFMFLLIESYCLRLMFSTTTDIVAANNTPVLNNFIIVLICCDNMNQSSYFPGSALAYDQLNQLTISVRKFGMHFPSSKWKLLLCDRQQHVDTLALWRSVRNSWKAYVSWLLYECWCWRDKWHQLTYSKS